MNNNAANAIKAQKYIKSKKPPPPKKTLVLHIPLIAISEPHFH
jgi:hypothetical protein